MLGTGSREVVQTCWIPPVLFLHLYWGNKYSAFRSGVPKLGASRCTDVTTVPISPCYWACWLRLMEIAVQEHLENSSLGSIALDLKKMPLDFFLFSLSLAFLCHSVKCLICWLSLSPLIFNHQFYTLLSQPPHPHPPPPIWRRQLA